ncbi:MAG: DUF3108 domain-containing protein [Candidatus Omnitrophota bacterium]
MKKAIAVLLLFVWAYVLFEKGYLLNQKNFTFPTLTLTPVSIPVPVPIPTFKIIEKPEEPISPPEEQQPPFQAQETFNFFYSMGPIRAGSAKLTFVGKVDFEGKDSFLINFESKVGVFYDFEKIYTDPETFYPLYVHRNINNLGFSNIIEERYDQVNYKVEIIKRGIFGKKSDVIKKHAPIQNAVLLIYSCRRLELAKLKPGYEFYVQLPVDEFKVIFRKINKIKTPAGAFNAYLFETEPEKIRLWISTDAKHIPLKMENLTSLGPSSIVFED